MTCLDTRVDEFAPIGQEGIPLAPQEYKAALSVWKQSHIADYVQNGLTVRNLRVEPTEKGNVHLYAEINEEDVKYVFMKGTPQAERILSSEVGCLTEEYLKELAKEHLLPKARQFALL